MLGNENMYRLSQPTLGLANFDLFPSSDFGVDPKLEGNRPRRCTQIVTGPRLWPVLVFPGGKLCKVLALLGVINQFLLVGTR